MTTTADIDQSIEVEKAWRRLAANILLLAIEDARQTKKLRKRYLAKEWLLSPAAGLIVEALDIDIDLKAWVKKNCP